MVELLKRSNLRCNILLVRRSVWSLVELQYALESLGMCGLWYFRRMLLTVVFVDKKKKTKQKKTKKQ